MERELGSFACGPQGNLPNVAVAGQERGEEQVALGVVNQQMAVAVSAIVTVVERELLLAVCLVVSGIEVQREPARAGAGALRDLLDSRIAREWAGWPAAGRPVHGRSP